MRLHFLAPLLHKPQFASMTLEQAIENLSGLTPFSREDEMLHFKVMGCHSSGYYRAKSTTPSSEPVNGPVHFPLKNSENRATSTGQRPPSAKEPCHNAEHPASTPLCGQDKDSERWSRIPENFLSGLASPEIFQDCSDNEL